ncbi:MAG: TRAP transporter substrate-binding protein [Spirochaetales bacterium]|nr:TRAP transporter substrate-binding protein [Spirochaetales bacterium]
MKKICMLLAFVLIATTLSFASGDGEEKGGGETYVFKYAHTQSESHPRSKSMVFFKDQLEKATNGRIKVELYFNGVLGKEAEVFDMVKLGTVQGSRGGLFERANKKFLIYTLPFMFENTDQVIKVMNSEMGAEINKGALENGLYIPATGVAGGFRNITNNVRPIKSVADVKGMKMRTPPIDMTLKTFAAIGASPQQVAYTETYMALKNGVVDGQENPFSNTADMKFYEAQKYLSVVNWQIHPDPFYVSPKFYDSLPADLKAVFDAVADATMKYSNEIWLSSEKDYYFVLKDNLQVNELDEAGRKSFVDACKPVYQGYVDDKFFTWDEINKVLEIAKQ